MLAAMTKSTRTPPWKRKRPAGPSMKLTPAEKAEARRNAERAGRRYPNLVDNLAVLRKRKQAAS